MFECVDKDYYVLVLFDEIKGFVWGILLFNCYVKMVFGYFIVLVLVKKFDMNYYV